MGEQRSNDRLRMVKTDKKFGFYSSRLYFIKVTDDQLMNIKLWHYLGVFESHVFGVFLQYERIKEDLTYSKPKDFHSVPSPQAGLDIYYYTLTWDKLKKIYSGIKTLINKLHQGSASFPKSFISEFRIWRRRIEHLFSEFDKEIRNEYEHPSLEPLLVGNLQMWGNIVIDGSGNIKAHAGKDLFATIKREHCEKMQQLCIDLFDLFIKHFSQKPLTQELIKARDYVENEIDSLLKELKELQDNKNWEEFNDLLNQILNFYSYLSKENVQLSTGTTTKIFSIFQPVD